MDVTETRHVIGSAWSDLSLTSQRKIYLSTEGLCVK